MIVGMDFGTTNTGAAVFRDDAIRLIPLDPSSSTPNICRTSLYITRTRDYHLGSQALSLYFNQNIGRPSRFKKIKVGEILQVFAELPPFYRDVFVFEDEYSPGRLFLSIKTALRNPNYFGTVFLDHWYSVSDLVAIFLIGMKQRMESHLGEPVGEVVLGRPVHFSNDPTEDKIAQSRLLEAAFKAGFEKVHLEYEPVAAALAYERSVKDKEVILVFDFGGGTLDFTIMEVGASSKPGPARERQVFATGGIPIAGDVFDQRLFRVTIPKHLGENDIFMQAGNRYPIPAHIFDLLSTPQEVLALNTPLHLEMLHAIHQGALHKEKTKALLQIVSSNYAMLLFDLVERAKRQLSSEIEARISLKTPEFALEEPVTRTRFQHAIRKEYEAIREELLKTVERSGLRPKDIDRVIRTGGSSQIPLFVRLLNEVFGWQKVREIDVFSSVTSGLSLRGREIAAGRAGSTEYTPAGFQGSEGISSRQGNKAEVAEIDLAAVRQRLEVTVALDLSQAGGLPEQTLLIAGGDGLHAIPAGELGAGDKTSWASEALKSAISGGEKAGQTQSLLAGMDDHVLLATSGFKLIDIPLRSLFVAGEVGRQAFADLLRLEPNEEVTAIAPWRPAETQKRFLCMVTRFGQARAFDARLLAEHLSKAPFFQLEKRYTGHPVALATAGEGETLLVGTDGGRVGRAPVSDMAVIVWEVLRARKDEEVTTAMALSAGCASPVMALSEAGTLLPVDLDSIPAKTPPAARGAFLRRNFNIAAFLCPGGKPGEEILLLSSNACVHRLSPRAGGETPHKALKLAQGERILARILR
jgi:hypothetical chaperone protein